MLAYTVPVKDVSEFAEALRDGLNRSGQREIPCKYLYDEVGSALFEVITLLPEYGLTRAEMRLLQTHADEIVDLLQFPMHVAELGSGSGKKTRWILEAIARRQRTYYYPIEISPAALAACEKELGQIEAVNMVGYERTYLEGLRAVANRRGPDENLLVLFLGSTIGNFERWVAEDFLQEIRKTLRSGDALLVGTDLQKPIEEHILAYDDPAGVTAAFNMNLLARINRELGANFNLAQFRHEARWNPSERRIEMHLRSLSKQRVLIPAANLRLTLDEGETIWTESSHKFRPEEVAELAVRTGFEPRARWIDREYAFAQNLWLVR